MVQLTGIPSKQSMMGDRYTFPASMENSVMSVNHFWLGFSAWKSLLIRFSTAGDISPCRSYISCDDAPLQPVLLLA